MPFTIHSGENFLTKFALLAMPDGATLIGAWDDVTNYVVGDVVIDADAAYVCTAPNINQEPPNASYWDALSGIPAEDVLNFKFELVTNNAAKVTYTYDGDTLPANMELVDGLITIEVLAKDTLPLNGTFEIRMTITVADADFFDSAGQTDVACLADQVTISPC